MQFNNLKHKSSSPRKIKLGLGFSMIEVVIAAAIFAVVSMAIYQGFVSITKLISVSRDKIAAIDLMNAEFELVRNIPFAQVGLVGGIPVGVVAPTSTLVVDGREFSITRVIRNVDDPFDGTIGGSPNDLSPADYKMMQVNVVCQNCKDSSDFEAHTFFAPKNLESASTNGALFVRVFDANGNPVSQANVSVQNSALGVSINETTNNDGLLQIVDAPPSQNSYRITVTKSGFTTDRTYATSTSNPNPVKIDATVLLQQLTQVSFVIDRVSDVNVRTITDRCAPVPNVPFSVDGTKLIGTTPNVFKWSGSFTTDSSGEYNISNLEWDVFSFGLSGGNYLAGTNPIFPISILPNSTQNVDLVVADGSPSFLSVGVKDASTGLPISGATVTISNGGFSETLITNQGYFRQTDWSGGSGQLDWGDESRFHSSDGNIDIDSPAGDIKLSESLGNFAPSGFLTSSIFDTGTSSNLSKVDILPTDQDPSLGVDPVKYQIATSPDNTATTTWVFLGPDGTNGTFYTITNNSINPIHNGDRYIRYRVFLSTQNTAFSPVVSDFVVSFSSSCIPPGQVTFSSLSQGLYDIEVSAPGYLSQTINDFSLNSSWEKTEVLMSP